MGLRPLVRRLRDRLVAVAAGPGDEVRRQFDVWIASLPGCLETSPSCASGERLKCEVLGSAGLRDWSSPAVAES